MALVATKCPNCGGDIQLDNEKKQGFCLYCGSAINVNEALNPKGASLTGSDEDVEKWKAAFETYILACDYSKAEELAHKILQAQPTDKEAIDRYYMAKVAGSLEIDSKGWLFGFKKNKYSGEKRVIIPPNVKMIYRFAFMKDPDVLQSSNSKLKINEIIIPSSVERIQWPISRYATIILEHSDRYRINDRGWIVSIDGRHLYQCPYDLSEVEAKDLEGIETIENAAFLGNSYLQKIELPDSVKVIKHDAFRNCSNLTMVVANSVENIGLSSFRDCENLTEINLVKVKEIGDASFKGCSNLRQVRMNSVKEIGEEAFSVCEKLGEVIIDGVESVGMAAFRGCSSLQMVKMNNVKIIKEEAFSGCANLFVVEMLGIEHIMKSAFKGCNSLGEVILMEHTEVLENNFPIINKSKRITTNELENRKLVLKSRERIEEYWREHPDERYELLHQKQKAQHELSSLGIFAGKRKKELENIITGIDIELTKDR